MICKCEKEEKNRRIKCPILLLFLILSVLGLVTVIVLSQGGNRGGNTAETTVPTENLGDGVGLVIDPNAKNNQLSQNDSTVEQDVAISGRGFMTISANKKEVTADFYNPKENMERYYLTFELRLYSNNEQGYEVLYTSGLVEPGKHITQITLSRGLEKGIYEAVVRVQPYRMNEKKTLTNNADMKIKLIVK